MINWLKDYAKSVYANKFTLAGYSAVLSSFGLMFADPKRVTFDEESCLLILGNVLLGATGFGLDTFRTYRRTKDHLKKFENQIKVREDDESFKRKESFWYCNRKGYELALKESGLEKHLSQR